MFILLAVLLAGCATKNLPSLSGLDQNETEKIQEQCANLFVEKDVQFIHSLLFDLPDKNTASVIGITNVYPSTGLLESIIMTVEGLVVFHSRYQNKQKTILKAIDPFTSEEFSTGVLEDIQLIFLKPSGSLEKIGISEDSAPVCRYIGEENRKTDIILADEAHWIIKKYDKKNNLTKTVSPISKKNSIRIVPSGYYSNIVLKTEGIFGYTLRLSLIQTEELKNLQ